MKEKQFLDDIRDLLHDITSSRKGSVGTLHNIYVCQLNRKRCDRLRDELVCHLSSESSGQDNACPKGGEHEWGIDGMHSNEYCKKCFISRR